MGNKESVVEKRPQVAVIAGVFLLAFCTLMYELLLTRIFSVTVYYHFAFMALSIAMFGISFGGVVAFAKREWIKRQNFFSLCAVNSIGFAVTALLAVVLHIYTPLVENGHQIGFNVLITYTVISLPFFFSGLVLSLVFKRFVQNIDELYAADLIGAGCGCLGLLLCLKCLDGLSAVLLVCAVGSLAACLFALPADSRPVRLSCLAALVGFLVFLGFNASAYNRGTPLMQITWVKGVKLARPLYEKWNSFSWIAVSGDPKSNQVFTYSGISKQYRPSHFIHGLNLDIDGFARTTLVGWESDLSKLDVLKFDLANVAHFLRPQSDVCVIGAGGGKDVVSALVFGQKHVTGVEINENTLNAVNNVFGDFTGHLDRNPAVTLVNDEARSYLARQNQRYDIIQMPFIDTWAATTNGAFVLTENSLYTVEAWKVFISRLTDRGIFTVSRWYDPSGRTEIMRLTGLAAQALKESGVAQPRNNIVVFANIPNDSKVGVGTLLLSRQPFSADDLDKIKQIAAQYQYEILVSPQNAKDDALAQIASGDIEHLAAQTPMDISPPYDDSPFFFNTLKLNRIFDPRVRDNQDANAQATLVLIEILVISISGSYLCIYLPMKFAAAPTNRAVSRPLVCFFLIIGVTYMLVEMCQIQRLIVFLGHPVYGISVVICSLLLSSGIGSFCSERLARKWHSRHWMCVLAVVIALSITGIVTPMLLPNFRQAETATRIVLAILLVSVNGFFMGMTLPMGLRVSARDNDELTPWYWGINGAGSVTGSVLAVMISLNLGITVLYWCAVVLYGLAALSLWKAEQALSQNVAVTSHS